MNIVVGRSEESRAGDRRVCYRSSVSSRSAYATTLTGTTSVRPDVNVNHYIAGLGYLLTDPESSFYVIVNLGAGALDFDVDAEGVESVTNFAINAGAEIGTWLTDSFSVFLSPQGDIAFTDSDGVLGTSSAWVWPFTAGLKLRLQ